MERVEMETPAVYNMDSMSRIGKRGSKAPRTQQETPSKSRQRNQRPTTAPARSSGVQVHNPEALLSLFADAPADSTSTGGTHSSSGREGRVRGERQSANSSIKIHNPEALASLFSFDEDSSDSVSGNEEMQIPAGPSSPRPGSGKGKTGGSKSELEIPAYRVSDSMRQSRAAHFKPPKGGSTGAGAGAGAGASGNTGNSPRCGKPSVRPQTSVRPHTSDGVGLRRQVPDDVFERILQQRKQQKQQQYSRQTMGAAAAQSIRASAKSSGLASTTGSLESKASAMLRKKRQEQTEKRRADAVLRATAETTLATMAAEQMAAYMEAMHLGVEDVCLQQVIEQEQAVETTSEEVDLGVDEGAGGSASLGKTSKEDSVAQAKATAFRVSARQRFADAKLMDDVCRSVDNS